MNAGFIAAASLFQRWRQQVVDRHSDQKTFVVCEWAALTPVGQGEALNVKKKHTFLVSREKLNTK